MVCYSTIRTLLKDVDRLGEALQQAGFAIEKRSNNMMIGTTTGGRKILFDRFDEKSAFVVTGDTSELTQINRRYAEIGVRSWARNNGFIVQEKAGNKITLVNRRG
jgi:hypothetical protein